MNEAVTRLKQYLLSGVSYVIPFVAAGGMMIAFSIALAPMGPHGPDFTGHPNLKVIADIGGLAFSFLVPVLSGYIAFGMADKPGLVAGFVGGAIANEIHAGFLGGLVSGLIAGFLVMGLKKLKVPRALRPVMPILVIPVLSSLVVGFVMFKVLGHPIQGINEGLKHWLMAMGTSSKVGLALALGAMIAFDMGGPVNKAAFFFATMMIGEGHFAAMGAVATAICIPPMGMGVATLLRRSLWTEQEREAGLAALVMGSIGITEGAIPFAAADPVRVIPSIMIGAMVGSVVAMLGGVGDHAPHGGPVVLPVVDHRLMFILAILAGIATTALLVTVLKLVTRPKV